LIYTDFFYYYLVASLILLVAMIGAIVLTMNKKETAKKQLIFKQVDRSFDDAIRYIENSKN
jgi:NADH-quinone oxidoreductase subunit J